MGAAQSTAGGFRVHKLSRGSPADISGLEPFFDFIIKINNEELGVERSSFLNAVRETIDKEATFDVFSLKTASVRQVRCTPNTHWGGSGSLGASIRYDVLDTTALGLHIVEVTPNSPAAVAGISPMTDWILGTQDVFLSHPDALSDLMLSAVESSSRVTLLVFSSLTNSIREVTVEPSTTWGGRGVLGCVPASGLIHRLPGLMSSFSAENKNKNENGPENVDETKKITLPTPPTRVMGDPNLNDLPPGDATQLRQQAEFVSPSRIPIGSLPPPPTPGSQGSPIVLPPQSSLPLPSKSTFGLITNTSGIQLLPPRLPPPPPAINNEFDLQNPQYDHVSDVAEMCDVGHAASPILQYGQHITNHQTNYEDLLGENQPAFLVPNDDTEAHSPVYAPAVESVISSPSPLHDEMLAFTEPPTHRHPSLPPAINGAQHQQELSAFYDDQQVDRFGGDQTTTRMVAMRYSNEQASPNVNVQNNIQQLKNITNQNSTSMNGAATGRSVSFNEKVALQPYDPSATPSATCVRSPMTSTFLPPQSPQNNNNVIVVNENKEGNSQYLPTNPPQQDFSNLTNITSADSVTVLAPSTIPDSGLVAPFGFPQNFIPEPLNNANENKNVHGIYTNEFSNLKANEVLLEQTEIAPTITATQAPYAPSTLYSNEMFSIQPPAAPVVEQQVSIQQNENPDAYVFFNQMLGNLPNNYEEIKEEPKVIQIIDDDINEDGDLSPIQTPPQSYCESPMTSQQPMANPISMSVQHSSNTQDVGESKIIGYYGTITGGMLLMLPKERDLEDH
eukprot:GDKK01067109.1.p1 GENE.GDKK01067109.1~~GDKK01067109.1.p1  ORF type:complete len:788 (-),score=185.23 GDKK01067109.1:55-2418(-)